MMNIIQDLDFVESQISPEMPLGGIYSYVNAEVHTGYKFSTASVSTVAIGANTSTWGSTNTQIINTSFSSNSYAWASGKSSAQTGGYSSQETVKFMSYSGYVDYFKV
jgi:hypothetical protein